MVKMEFIKVTMRKKWGGKRKNAGRKKGLPASYMSFRILKEDKNKLKSKYGTSIHQLFKEWISQLLQ